MFLKAKKEDKNDIQDLDISNNMTKEILGSGYQSVKNATRLEKWVSAHLLTENDELKDENSRYIYETLLEKLGRNADDLQAIL